MQTSLAQRLKTAREDKGLSVKQVTTITGIDVFHYSNVEQGFAIPSEDGIKTLAELFNVTPEWLERGEIIELEKSKPRAAANENSRFILTSQGPRPPINAPDFLQAGINHMQDRASQRDCEDGERSMASTVKAFNALFGTNLTETMGWEFMVLLKMSRAKNGAFNKDDFEDGAAYFALAGEAASKEAA